MTITFKKTGKEIKTSITSRLTAIQSRLEKRNRELDELLEHPKKIRSYILRNTQANYNHGVRFGNSGQLYGSEHISSEEVEEINQMCKRIMELENAITKLKLIDKHLNDDELFELTFEELVQYGFST